MPMTLNMGLSTDEFSAALGEQVTCYRRLLRLSGAQHECVAQGQTDQLLDILQGRQRELEKITEIEARIRPLKRDWHAVAESLDADERASAEALLAESRSLLAEITKGRPGRRAGAAAAEAELGPAVEAGPTRAGR